MRMEALSDVGLQGIGYEALQYDTLMYMKDGKAKNVEDKIVYLFPCLLRGPKANCNASTGKNIKQKKHIPCGGGVEYFLHSPARHRRQRKGTQYLGV
jgi:hypothetical protein